MNRKEYQKNGKGAVTAACIGAGISLIFMLAGTLIIALLIMKETMTQEAIGYGTVVVTLLSSLAGAYAAAVIYGKQLFIMTMSVSIVFALILMSLTALFFDGQFTGVPVTLLMVSCGGICAMLLAGKGRHQRKSHRKKLKL